MVWTYDRRVDEMDNILVVLLLRRKEEVVGQKEEKGEKDIGAAWAAAVAEEGKIIEMGHGCKLQHAHGGLGALGRSLSSVI